MLNEYELLPAPPLEKEIVYVVDLSKETISLKELFPNPIEPTEMIQLLWKYIIDKNLLRNT